MELDEDKVVVVAAAVQAVGRDKVLDGWGAPPPGRVVTASARRVGIASRIVSGRPVPEELARSVARG